MRSATRLGFGQLVAFVAVALVLNAQFTWWVVYSLRENRDRLDLLRANLGLRAAEAGMRMEAQLEDAGRGLRELPSGVIPAPTQPFTEVRVVDVDVAQQQTAGWIEYEGRAAFARPLGRGRLVLAFLDPQAPYRWLASVSADLELVEARAGESHRPQVALGPPFKRFAITPDFHRWEELLDRYRQRVLVVLGEGVFFFGAIATAILLLWRALRREGVLERQHQNFVSAVTHELKTPIAGIRLALETVLSGRVDDDGRTRFLNNALLDTERLGDLVEKVLEVTRYTGGAHRLRISPGDLSQLVEEEINAAGRRALARGIRLESDVAPGIQAPFDPEAFAIVISNLVENALKYAKGPPPRVDVRLQLQRGEAVLEVRDNGIGIAANEIEAIFQPFYRANDEVTRRTPGTGIGLYVAREIVAAHGGRLSASSDGPGKGATFRLVLPAAEALADEEFSE